MNARLRRIFKLPLWVPTPANRRLQRAVAELDQTVQGFIAAGRSRQRPGNDLLSRLLLAQHEDGTRMSDRQLRDEAMTLYLAGHETTALTLTWTGICSRSTGMLKRSWYRSGSMCLRVRHRQRTSAPPALHGRRDRRVDAVVPACVRDRARGHYRTGTWRIPGEAEGTRF